MKVSVLICTRDRRDMLGRLLPDIQRQAYAGEVEIIVVEETESPKTPEGVKYAPHPVRNLGIAFARNLALENASHDLIVFVDDDCRVAPDWLGKLVRPLVENPEVLGVQGGVTVPEGTNATGWVETLLGFPGGGVNRIHQAKGRVQETTEISTLNAAYRKQAVLDAGSFDEAARFGGEDYLLAKRVAQSGQLMFVPDAVVQHAARGSISAIWRWFMRRGKAESIMVQSGLLAQGGVSYLFRASLLLKLLLVFPFTLWLGLWPLLALLLLYAGAVWWRLFWVWHDANVPKTAWFVAPMVKACMDIAADVGRLQGLLHQ